MFQSLRKGKYPSKEMHDPRNPVTGKLFQSLRKGKYPSKYIMDNKIIESLKEFQSLRKGKYPSKIHDVLKANGDTSSFNP